MNCLCTHVSSLSFISRVARGMTTRTESILERVKHPLSGQRYRFRGERSTSTWTLESDRWLWCGVFVSGGLSSKVSREEDNLSRKSKQRAFQRDSDAARKISKARDTIPRGVNRKTLLSRLLLISTGNGKRASSCHCTYAYLASASIVEQKGHLWGPRFFLRACIDWQIGFARCISCDLKIDSRYGCENRNVSRVSIYRWRVYRLLAGGGVHLSR